MLIAVSANTMDLLLLIAVIAPVLIPTSRPPLGFRLHLLSGGLEVIPAVSHATASTHKDVDTQSLPSQKIAASGM